MPFNSLVRVISAIIYSIVEIAKESRLNPYEYLKFLFEKLPNVDVKNIEVIDELLPWSSALPSICKIKK